MTGASAAPGGGDTRIRILEATLACVEREGLTKASLEDVAQTAGLSRATVYRYFPGGRDQLISDTISYEIDSFLRRVGAAVDGEVGIAAKLTRALLVGHQAIDDHLLLQQILSTEPEALLTELAQADPRLLVVIRHEIAGYLASEPLHDSIVIAEAAEYLARMFLSYIGSQGEWDLTDPATAARLVATQFLAGVVVAPGEGPTAAIGGVDVASRS